MPLAAQTLLHKLCKLPNAEVVPMYEFVGVVQPQCCAALPIVQSLCMMTYYALPF